MQQRNTTARALARFALVAAAGAAAAAVWASSRPEQGLLLDAQTWQQEVVAANTGPWAADGWYQLVARDEGIEVRAVAPSECDSVPPDAVFFRLPGVVLKTGLRTSQADREQVGTPRPGRFGVRVEDTGTAVRYAISYAGGTYRYDLPRGTPTTIEGVADLDGDGRPDFLVDVADRGRFLLLSTRARPGTNTPTAELPAHWS